MASAALDGDYSAGRAATEGGNETYKSGQRSRQQPGSACEECRRKRIRCDRGAPQCMACANAGVTCVVRSTCAPRGPKKGHLRTLQKQIEDLQNRLKDQTADMSTAATQVHADSTLDNAPNPEMGGEDASSEGYNEVEFASIGSSTDILAHSADMQCWSPQLEDMSIDNLHASFMFPGMLAEPQYTHIQALPPASFEIGVHPNLMICADLDQLYFDRVHAFAPILHESRYLSWSKRPDKTKPQMCLQYAMWTLAASLSTQFQHERRSLYTEARQLLVALEAENQANHINPSCLSIEQVQAWILLVIYELTNTDCNYQRGMLSAGRAFRLVQIMRLYEIDGAGVNHAGQGDWIETESMRRTFWLAYTVDRFTSAIDGLPLAFNERQIRTRLPAPDAHFMSGRPITMCFLSEMVNGLDGDRSSDNVWPFTTSIIIATICGRALEHKHFLPHADQDQDITYDYCQQFQSGQSLNALLTQHIKFLSNHISLASERPDPVIVFVTLVAHMAVFILSETMESRPQSAEPQSQGQKQGTPGSDAMAIDHKQPLLNIVHKLSTLTATLGQLNHFRTHPLTPIPLLLSARFCLTHTTSNDAYGALLPVVTTALKRLGECNGLARMCVQRLGLERDVLGPV